MGCHCLTADHSERSGSLATLNDGLLNGQIIVSLSITKNIVFDNRSMKHFLKAINQGKLWLGSILDTCFKELQTEQQTSTKYIGIQPCMCSNNWHNLTQYTMTNTNSFSVTFKRYCFRPLYTW